MTPARVIRLVVGREVGDRLRNRAFVVTTAIAVVAIAGIIVGPTLFGDDGPTEWDVGVLDGADVPAGFGDVFVTVAESADVVASARDVPDRAAADRAVEDGDLDAVVIDQSTVLGTDVGGDLRRTIEQA